MTTKVTVMLPDKSVADIQHLARAEGVTVTEAFNRAILRQQFLDEQVQQGNKILLEKDSWLTWLSTGGRTGKSYREVKFNLKPRVLTAAEKTLRGLGCAYRRQAGGFLRVDGDIDLSGRNLAVLPDLSNVILKGSFLCGDNALTSLKGVPLAVGGSLMCSGNRLADLEEAPAAFGRLVTDFGSFGSWAEVPKALAPKTKMRQLNEAVRNATELQSPVAVGKPFRFRKNR